MIKVNVFPIQEIRGVLPNVIHSKTLNVEMNKSQILRCMKKGKVFVGDVLLTYENIDKLYEEASDPVVAEETVATPAVEEVKVETPAEEPVVEETAPAEEVKTEDPVVEPAVEEVAAPAEEETPAEETPVATEEASTDEAVTIVEEPTVDSKKKNKK